MVTNVSLSFYPLNYDPTFRYQVICAYHFERFVIGTTFIYATMMCATNSRLCSTHTFAQTCDSSMQDDFNSFIKIHIKLRSNVSHIVFCFEFVVVSNDY